MSALWVMPTGPEAAFRVSGVGVADGFVVATMPTGAPFTGPDGRPALGALGVLADDVLGHAVMASLAPGAWSVSTEIGIDLVGLLPTDGSPLSARARAVGAGSFATGDITAADGRLVAVCRQRGRETADLPSEDDSPLHEPCAGAASIAELLDLQVREDRLVLEVTPRVSNPRWTLHGGVSLCASEIAATQARPPGAAHLISTSVHIAHVRAVPLGAVIEFHTTTRHAGRSLWVSDVVGVVEGRTATLARVSAERAPG